MTIFILTTIMAVIIIIPICVFLKKGNNLFSPWVISLILLFISTIPYMYSISNNHFLIGELVLNEIGYSNLPTLFAKFVLIFSIGVVGLVIGMKKNVSTVQIKISGNKESYGLYIGAFYITFFMGLLGYFLFFQSAGGVINFINNIEKRASFTSGSGYVMLLMSLLEVSAYLLIYSFKYKNTKPRFFLLILFVLFVCICQSSLGGRKGTIQFLIFSAIFWNFSVGKIKNIKPKIILILPIILMYIISVPLVRRQNAIENYLNTPSLLADDFIEEVSSVTKQVSYVDTYLFIISYFQDNDKWYGISYIDLMFAPIPSNLFLEKPPVDDGMYIRSLAAGMQVKPSLAAKKLYQSSWPPETFGAMYMNFGVLGVFFGMVLLGYIYRKAYVYMIKSNCSFISIIVYGNILLNFHLSNLRIVQTLSTIVFLVFFLSVIFFLNRKISIRKKGFGMVK